MCTNNALGVLRLGLLDSVLAVAVALLAVAHNDLVIVLLDVPVVLLAVVRGSADVDPTRFVSALSVLVVLMRIAAAATACGDDCSVTGPRSRSRHWSKQLNTGSSKQLNQSRRPAC